MKWSKNGHVTRDTIRSGAWDPARGLPDSKNFTVRWTGKPGNRNITRGELEKLPQIVPEQGFDDGQCYEITEPSAIVHRRPPNGPVSLSYHGNYTIPEDAEPGVYQIISWWVFDKAKSAGGEEYTVC